MSLFDIFKKKIKKRPEALSMSYFTPSFIQSGTDVLHYEIVRQALSKIIKEMKKLHPQHIIHRDGKIQPVNDSIQHILDSPNYLMTTTDFIERITWTLLINCNAFILPEWDTVSGDLKALYPLSPNHIEWQQDEAGRLYVELTFANDYKGIIPYDNIIHLRTDYVGEFMGGDARTGQPDNSALLNELRSYQGLKDSVKKSVESSAQITAVCKTNGMLNAELVEQQKKELLERIKNNDSAILIMDNKAELVPFQRDIKLVDKDTLDFMEETILRHYGISKAIMSGDYSKQQLEAFIQSVIEPLICTFNQAFTKVLFTKRERESFGHEIKFNHNLLDFMTVSEKIAFLQQAASYGMITPNMGLQLFGLDTLAADYADSPIMSKNYGEASQVASQIAIENNKEEVINNEV